MLFVARLPSIDGFSALDRHICPAILGDQRAVRSGDYKCWDRVDVEVGREVFYSRVAKRDSLPGH